MGGQIPQAETAAFIARTVALERLVADQAAWRHQHADAYDGRHRGSGFAACDHAACREAQTTLTMPPALLRG